MKSYLKFRSVGDYRYQKRDCITFGDALIGRRFGVYIGQTQDIQEWSVRGWEAAIY